MKIFLVLLICFYLIACNSNTKTSEAKNTDLIISNLKGKVQTLEETTYNIDSIGNKKADSTVGTDDFDEKGYITKYTEKDSSGKTTMVQTIAHNTDGAFTEVITMKDGKQTYKLVTVIDSGKYTGGKTYDSTGKQDSYYTDLKTNDYGEVYAGKDHFMNGKIKFDFTSKYDGPNYVGGKTLDSLGKTSYEATVKLDEKGNAIEQTTTTLEKDSPKTETVTYKYDSYDDHQNWSQQTTYNDKGKPTKIVKRVYTYYKD